MEIILLELIEKLGSSSPHEVTDLGSRDTLPWSTK